MQIDIVVVIMSFIHCIPWYLIVINLQEYHYWHYCWPREDTATREYRRLVPCYLVTWIIFTAFVGQICLCMEKLPCQYSIVQANSDSVMVLYMYFWSSQRPLVKWDLILTGVTYTDLVANHLHPFMFNMFSDHDGLFHQDNIAFSIHVTWN